MAGLKRWLRHFGGTSAKLRLSTACNAIFMRYYFDANLSVCDSSEMPALTVFIRAGLFALQNSIVPLLIAVTEPDGSFRLMTYAADDGAPAADYVGTIFWRDEWIPIDDCQGENLTKHYRLLRSTSTAENPRCNCPPRTERPHHSGERPQIRRSCTAKIEVGEVRRTEPLTGQGRKGIRTQSFKVPGS
jgi:hypothetical protein